jgi:HD-GYP domain-containing protein (c-di-GMP phosphodiesterase class II)
MLGELAGQSEVDRSHTYYTALLRHLGCTAFAHEAGWLAAGDDQGLLQTFEGVDGGSRLHVGTQAIARLRSDAPLVVRATAVARTLSSFSAADRLAAAQCEQAMALAADLGMDGRVVRALGQIYERFEGRGSPLGLRGEEIELSARIAQVASVLEVHHRQGGRPRAMGALRERAGVVLDPSVCSLVDGRLDRIWATLEAPSPWAEFQEAEPLPHHRAGDLDKIALVFARYADLKSPIFLGHSEGVANLAVSAARADGMADASLPTLRRAALLHDIGIVAVPNGLWEKRAAFDVAEQEQARIHAFFSSRILARLPEFAQEAKIAALHHERCDGSGYPLGAEVPSSARAARLLAAADAYHALTEARAHRPARSPRSAATVLRQEAQAGALCTRAVDCVLAAAGIAPRPDAETATQLTPRELDVLVHLARGLTNKESAVALGIAPRTIRHHIEHIYAKIGVSTRAGAALFAVRNGILPAHTLEKST